MIFWVMKNKKLSVLKNLSILISGSVWLKCDGCCLNSPVLPFQMYFITKYSGCATAGYENFQNICVQKAVFVLILFQGLHSKYVTLEEFLNSLLYKSKVQYLKDVLTPSSSGEWAWEWNGSILRYRRVPPVINFINFILFPVSLQSGTYSGACTSEVLCSCREVSKSHSGKGTEEPRSVTESQTGLSWKGP